MRAYRQFRDLSADQSLRHTQFVQGLQIEPELRAVAEPMAEAQCGVAGDCPLARNDLADAVRRNAKLPGKLGRADADLFQLVGKDFAGVNRWSRHGQW